MIERTFVYVTSGICNYEMYHYVIDIALDINNFQKKYGISFLPVKTENICSYKILYFLQLHMFGCE